MKKKQMEMKVTVEVKESDEFILVRSDVKGLGKVLRHIIESRVHDDGWKLKNIPNNYRHMWWASFQEYTRSQMDFQTILSQQVPAAVALAMSGQTQPRPPPT